MKSAEYQPGIAKPVSEQEYRGAIYNAEAAVRSAEEGV